jgi:hypothetical protein
MGKQKFHLFLVKTVISFIFTHFVGTRFLLAITRFFLFLEGKITWIQAKK